MSVAEFVSNLRVGPPWSHLSLTVHPLLGHAGEKPTYLTLDEALTTGHFEICEVSTSGMVPELSVRNSLKQPVLMLDGEELIGAKQNRVLNLSIMVPAATEITIPVSCVEAGRWRDVSSSFLATDRAQFARGRARKVEQVSACLQQTGDRRSDQSDVWEEIASKSARMSASSPTGAMSAIYEHNEEKLDMFIKAMPKHPLQVGAVFSIDGRIAGLDALGSDETYDKLKGKLLRSYAVDALESGGGSRSDLPDADAIRALLGDIAAAQAIHFKAVGLGDDLRLKGLALAGAALRVAEHIVHLVAFPSSVVGNSRSKDSSHSAMARAGRRRAFH